MRQSTAPPRRNDHRCRPVRHDVGEPGRTGRRAWSTRDCRVGRRGSRSRIAGLAGELDEGELLAVTSSMETAGHSVVVGVDFGTLSGRAVVVRVERRRGARVGRPRIRHGVIDTRCPPGERLPPDWALQEPADWLEVLARRSRKRSRPAEWTRPHVVGIATAFTASTVLPVLRDGTPLCRLDDSRAGRTRSRNSGSITPPSRRPTGSTRSPHERREPWIDRTAAGSPRSGSSRRPSRCSRRTPRCTPRPNGGSRPPTGSSGSCAARDP